MNSSSLPLTCWTFIFLGGVCVLFHSLNSTTGLSIEFLFFTFLAVNFPFLFGFDVDDGKIFPNHFLNLPCFSTFCTGLSIESTVVVVGILLDRNVLVGGPVSAVVKFFVENFNLFAACAFSLALKNNG